VGLLSALGLALWGFWIEPARLTVREEVLGLPGWPKECAGVRMAVVGDLHVGSPHQGVESLRRIVAAIEGARPDVVLLPGDFVIHGVPGGRFVTPETIAAELAGLTAARPVFAVLGNHDHWYDAARVEGALEATGITVLENESAEVRLGGCSLWVSGLSDLWTAEPDAAAALAAVPPGAALVGFTHNPDVFPALSDRFALVVAAHTHGGQVRIPLVGRPIVPSRFGERYAIGHVVEEGRHLFVNPGTGTSILPVRFLVPPEVSVLELR
jgi:hypothetical protein